MKKYCMWVHPEQLEYMAINQFLLCSQTNKNIFYTNKQLLMNLSWDSGSEICPDLTRSVFTYFIASWKRFSGSCRSNNCTVLVVEIWRRRRNILQKLEGSVWHVKLKQKDAKKVKNWGQGDKTQLKKQEARMETQVFTGHYHRDIGNWYSKFRYFYTKEYGNKQRELGMIIREDEYDITHYWHLMGWESRLPHSTQRIPFIQKGQT